MKMLDKRKRGRIHGTAQFFRVPFIIRNGPRSQGLPKIFRAPIHRAHRAAIFAIAQLSCIVKN